MFAAPQIARSSTPEMVASLGRSAPKASPKAAKGEYLYGLPGTGHLYGLTKGFDPLGFAEGKSKDEVFRLREAEITHARVAMLACAGFLVQEKVHPLFSGDGGPAIDQIPALPDGYIPGDLGFDPANIRPKSPEKLRLMQERELANGRLAMLGAAGFLLQEAITGQTWGAAWGI